ncbi:hypothetical protein BpHYR1_021615 [Brachionus plicatilis]|uniref:Uncharacterized protein n=1 Tax=Brachionus plicatilis TaxID=10195 RepID=A0A3M7PKQ8_BRAPC|nr:hypothetical protein BpHYR1_021615 [Brachionus plicatilis]
MASESVLNRVSSSKTPKSSMNSSVLSHPIFLEYIKVYDIVISFKNLIIKNLPASENQTTSYKKFYDRLNALITMEYDSNLTATPQVINMTANIDIVLNEVKLIFSELIDENLSLKYDLLDKEHQLATRPNTGINSEIDQILRVKEFQMNEREEVLKKLECEISHKLEIIDGKNLEIELKKTFHQQRYLLNIAFNEYKNLLTKYESETKTLKDQINNYKTDIESLQNRNYELIRSKSFVLPPIKRKSEDSTSTQFIMFTKLDAIQNEKRMRKGIIKGALTEQEFQKHISTVYFQRQIY